MLKGNAMMKKLVATGEERIGELVQQLMSNEKFVSGVQTILSRGLSAKGAVDKSIRGVLSAMNLPSTADLEKLGEKCDELEKLMGTLEEKVDRLLAAKKK